VVRCGISLFSILGAQVWIGAGFSPQQGLTGKDTVFRLTGASQLFWVEYKTSTRLPWDTLWVILRTPDKVQGAYRLYRVKNNPLLYRGQIRVRTASIHLAIIIPPREYRQVLGRKRFYITDAAHPTIASLRNKAQTQTAQAQPTDLGEVTLENLDIPTDALLSTPENLPDVKLDEPLLEEDSLDLDMPDLDSAGTEEDALDLDDFGDLDDL